MPAQCRQPCGTAGRDAAPAASVPPLLRGLLSDQHRRGQAACGGEPGASPRHAAGAHAACGRCRRLPALLSQPAGSGRRRVSCRAEEQPGRREPSPDAWAALRRLAGLGGKPPDKPDAKRKPPKPRPDPRRFGPPGPAGEQGAARPPLSGVSEAAQNAVDRQVAQERDEGGTWEEWARPPAAEGDWESSSAADAEIFSERRRRAWDRRQPGTTPRDSFLRPMVDLEGARARLRLNSDKSAVELEEEFADNRWESQEAVKYAAYLFGVPLLIGFVVSRLLGEPFLEVMRASNPSAFQLSDQQKIEGAHEVHMHEMRLRMDAAIGRAPPISEVEVQIELRKEARHLEREFRERNRRAIVNVLSDGTSGTVLFAILARRSSGRANLFRTLSRVASGLSDTAKAFLIIAVTDILLGYHSEEGWTAALRMLSGHYGMEAEDKSIYVFVAIVPVVMDAIFKYWIFKGLNGQDPAAAATLRNMDRH